MVKDRLKNSKPFHVLDISIYLVIALVVFVLFLGFVIIPHSNSNAQSKGFTVELDGKTIITYYYGTDSFDINNDFIPLITKSKTENGFELTIYTSTNKDGFNLLTINEKQKTVKMTDSDCRSKQCTYLHEIGNNGIIFCAPRSLKISPIGGSGFMPPVTG